MVGKNEKNKSQEGEGLDENFARLGKKLIILKAGVVDVTCGVGVLGGGGGGGGGPMDEGVELEVMIM